MSYQNDDEDMLSEREFPDESDMDSEEGGPFSSTMCCPACGKVMYAEVERCRHCGHYLSSEDLKTRTPIWFIVGVIFCLLVVVFMWLR